jgi:predicted short-subunit dehydrogenase-like oxidoreductase (DUF2520 family)
MAELPAIGFIGAGRVARVLAPAFAGAGYRVVGAASRSFVSAEALAATVPGCAATNGQGVLAAADLVFITTNDAAIADAVRDVAWAPGKAAVHCSGASTLEPLARAKEAGAAVGSWHPFQTFGAAGTTTDLDGITVGIDAEAPLDGTLGEIARRLGATPIAVPEEARALYHAASVMTCGYLTTLLYQAQALWESAGLPPEAAGPAIGKIAQSTLGNVIRAGAHAALTGPTSRGDEATVRRHLQAVSAAAPELLPLYSALTERSVALAREAGRDPGNVDWESLLAGKKED